MTEWKSVAREMPPEGAHVLVAAAADGRWPTAVFEGGMWHFTWWGKAQREGRSQEARPDHLWCWADARSAERARSGPPLAKIDDLFEALEQHTRLGLTVSHGKPDRELWEQAERRLKEARRLVALAGAPRQ